MIIVYNIKAEDKGNSSLDTDKTDCATIKMIAEQFGGEFELGFAIGGDQNNESCLETSICGEMDVTLIDGLGDKIQSSSWLLGKKRINT